MKLQTQIPIKKEARNPISYESKILLIGSCFSENIGNKLDYYKFQSAQNPFGILFQPKAIEKLITSAINEREYTVEDLVFQNERWHCFDAHSSLSSTDKNELINSLNSTISLTNKQTKEATHLIITLGTSWVYRFIETDAIVANCHKIPQKKFLKELLSVDEVSESLEAIIELIKSVNKDINILFTVSPVRHLKDGFIENTQSKSHLIAGIHNVVNPRNKTHYFPSYEIMMDELRDYRFYAEDMIHPNKTAINYIWEKFVATWFSDDSKTTMQEIETIQKGISHRPFNENSDSHKSFLKNLEVKISNIKTKIPNIEF
ncbi:GSCFA domain-containing protein [Polaribacter pectinis]|uniref:GSCFA domain-containing protein n=1 Tax=Polaribacter pectinis TaxID=2738844 RepID=A0A7G9L7R4_9FLAO|nr:GSCFA domain-containing protein [Polaribacter pectinis]QNM84663.1 GSCFA domain-containing protein [Polaribacter pectinis]